MSIMNNGKMFLKNGWPVEVPPTSETALAGFQSAQNQRSDSAPFINIS